MRYLIALAVLAGVLGVGRSEAAADAELIAFERRSGTGVADIYVVRPNGTGLRRLTRDRQSFDPAWSPDGKRLAFVRDRAGFSGAPELYLMHADGSNVRRLTPTLRGPTRFDADSQPAWTPDGRKIVFVRLSVRGSSASTDLWEIGADGKGLRRLTSTKAAESSPAFSDGTLYFERGGSIYAGARKVVRGSAPAFPAGGGPLAFERDGGIFVMYDGSAERIAAGSSPAWTPDGRRLVYSGRDGLYSIDADGTGRRRVTRSASLIHDLGASWRPAVARSLAATAPGGTLAFERNTDIYAGGRNLTRTPKVKEYAPAWSPDGGRIAYLSYRDGNGEIYVMKADGTAARRLTRHRGEDLSPAWSPDGTRIAFVSNRPGEFEIYVMRADGSGVRRLTRLSRRGQGTFSPAWSPNGRMIVFSSAGRTPENPELYSIRADGSGLKRLTFTEGDSETLGDDGFPSWSPDGKTIVFTSNRTGNGELWTMRPDGSGQRRLAGLPRRDDWAPRYSPDGGWIVFESRPAQGSDVYAVRSDGTGAKRLLRNASAPSWRP